MADTGTSILKEIVTHEVSGKGVANIISFIYWWIRKELQKEDNIWDKKW